MSNDSTPHESAPAPSPEDAERLRHLLPPAPTDVESDASALDQVHANGWIIESDPYSANGRSFVRFRVYPRLGYRIPATIDPPSPFARKRDAIDYALTHSLTPSQKSASDPSEGAVVVDTPAGVEMYRLLALAHALAIEINTGMSTSRGRKPLAIVQGDGITEARTKRAALRDLVKHIQRLNPAYVPGSTIVRAMGDTK